MTDRPVRFGSYRGYDMQRRPNAEVVCSVISKLAYHVGHAIHIGWRPRTRCCIIDWRESLHADGVRDVSRPKVDRAEADPIATVLTLGF